MTKPQVLPIDVDTERTLSGRTTVALREAIVNGEIAPGEKLNEPGLAKRFNVSRGPLREAIGRLVALRLVRHIPHQGATVVNMELTEILELYEVREALEGKAAALAARNMTPPEIERLKELLEIHRQHYEENAGEYLHADSDIDFHYQIIKGSGNQYLINQLCNELYHLIRMYRVQTSHLRKHSNRALTEHAQLIYAIEHRDADMAEMVMRHHTVRAKESIRDLLNKNTTQEQAHEQ